VLAQRTAFNLQLVRLSVFVRFVIRETLRPSLFAMTTPTRQDCLVLSVSAMWIHIESRNKTNCNYVHTASAVWT